MRTPLTTILGWSSLLRSGAVPEARVPDALATIERNARAQARLIEDVLDVARVTTAKLSLDTEPMRPVQVLSTELNAIRPVLEGKGLRLVADLDSGGDAIIEADPARFRQVASNLLSNAAKFTETGGEIRVRALVRGCDFEFSVEDSGCGIAPDFMPHVFDRFRQAEDPPRGFTAGSGWASRSRATSCSCTAARSTSTARAPAAARGDAALRGIRALVADDDADTRDLVRTLLESRGARVTCASGAAQVFLCLGGGDFDVLLADIAMPQTDG